MSEEKMPQRKRGRPKKGAGATESSAAGDEQRDNSALVGEDNAPDTSGQDKAPEPPAPPEPENPEPPAPPEPEPDKKPRRPGINWDRPYAQMHGTNNGVKFSQDGRYFDGAGREIAAP